MDYLAHVVRSNVSDDIFRLKDESLEDSANLPDPDVIAQEIDSRIPIRSPFGLAVHVVRSRDLHCRRSRSRSLAIRRLPRT